MSHTIRCDAPACTVVSNLPLAATWAQTTNASGYPVHGHSAAHLTAAAATTGDPTVTAIAV
jgi:hypothetical protein